MQRLRARLPVEQRVLHKHHRLPEHRPGLPGQKNMHRLCPVPPLHNGRQEQKVHLRHGFQIII